MDPKPGGVVGQKFMLERPLARGGMGSVWLGRHLLLDIPIAVKFMEAGADATRLARTRFEREARAAAQLPSPHVVRILDYGVENDTPYIVMEMLEGEDLRARLKRERRLAVGEVVTLIRQIAKGLKLAHDAGIVHRDLKPSNVFLARVGEEEIVKILDFGVAKETRSFALEERTTTGLLVGSPEYMSPEQARGGRIDHRSDLWSLGVIAFVALTGHRPFASQHLGDVLVKICTEELPRATELAQDLSPAIDAFFARALCRSADGRFPSAVAMADALAIAAGEHEVAAVSQPSGSLAAHSIDGDSVVARTDETVPVGVALDAPTPPARFAESAGAAKLATRTEPARAGRGWGWGVAGAAVVGVLWAGWASRSMLVPGSERSPIVSAVRDAPSQSAASAPPAAVDQEPPPNPSAAPAASARLDSAPPPSAATQRAAPPVAPHRARPAPAAAPATAKIDPKFGLPVDAPR